MMTLAGYMKKLLRRLLNMNRLYLCEEKRRKLLDSLVKMGRQINSMFYIVDENEVTSREVIDFEDDMKDLIKEFVKTLEE